MPFSEVYRKQAALVVRALPEVTRGLCSRHCHLHSFPAFAAPSEPPGGRRPHTAMVMADMVAKAGSFNRASASSTSSAMIAPDLIAKPAVFWIARRRDVQLGPPARIIST